ncbi:MAG: hypothetical protein D6732_07895 [Methanobacteriota archaeon]|nr:MAG: hypothetical protein D6732_07895 [Euryarchaeota archaeon]
MGLIGRFLVNILTLPIFLVAIISNLILVIYDAVFPPKFQEYVPLLEVNRTFLLALSRLLADPKRLEAEQALSQFSEMASKVDEVAEGYALRKGIGQTVDFALSGVALSLGLIAFFSQERFGEFGPVLIFIFSSATMALSTFAGIFGPPYALAEQAKLFCLRHGNYRGAVIFKAIESVLAIPFISTSAGFLLLDMPPVDQDSLEEFKEEMSEQLNEVAEKLTTLLGREEGQMPKKAREMISELMGSSEENLSKLDFRNIREEKAREFALQYYQLEFPLRPWKRKKAVKEFAEKYHLTVEEAEFNLMNMSFKIQAGQEDEDLINNLLITAALKAIIMEEQKFSEYFEDLELGQISTGLAFGARQFLKDHYSFREKNERIKLRIKNFFIGIFALPIVLLQDFYAYAIGFYKYWVTEFVGTRKRSPLSFMKLRYQEIRNQLLATPQKMRESISKFRNRTPHEKKQRRIQIGRIVRQIFVALIEFIILPFKVIFKATRWLVLKLFGKTTEKKETFESEIAHVALVSMYDELFQTLMLSSRMSTGY